ncbi:substrate-binding domain-containing protein [Bdellovibrio bacteriovorus]|uniref:substrate-binding domain-containing protein n=1 Tax=Bdellovibrio bacteriovorus TaxID=959 RepID=UPI0021D2B74E|nr:substrate-binding domain-containing protein [Bdellovibrio bacteriovorus]UXR66171.1 substrate-binding domain-containing protein [Bdellovibrio bacteriovorus]
MKYLLCLSALPVLLLMAPVASQAHHLDRIKWTGPTTGPQAQDFRTVHFIASDLKNGGTSAISESFLSAVRVLKWQAQIFDGKGNPTLIRQQLLHSISQKVDGLVLGGFDAEDHPEEIKRAQAAGIRILGWHASAKPGPSKLLFTNITTDPLDVAERSALMVRKFGPSKAGVVLITDSNFAIALAKTERMKKILEDSKDVNVLTTLDLSISRADHEAPKAVETLQRKYGKKWTHTLAINDVYFDHMNFPLKKIGRKEIVNISAGDGSVTALTRIKSGLSQQVATIAEPLRAQGWQIADELNRAFAGLSPSGYVSDPIEVTKVSLDEHSLKEMEGRIPFEDSYMKIWYPGGH